MRDQKRPKPAHAVDRRAVGEDGRRIDRNAALRVRQRPMASKFSIANPSGSMRTWHTAHAGFGDAFPSARESRYARPSAPSRLEIRHIGRRRGRRHAEEVVEHPEAAHDRAVRSGYNVTIRMPPCPSSPPRTPSVNDVAEAIAGDAASRRSAAPAVRSQTSSRRCSRSTMLRSSRSWLSRKSDVSRRNASRRFSSNSGKTLGREAAGRLFAGRAIGSPKLSTSAFDRGSRSMRRTC